MVKRKKKSELLNSFVATKVEAELKDRLKKEAKSRGLSTSALVRMWIIKEVKKS